MNASRWILGILLLVGSAGPGSAPAESQQALVLSGGSARGLAHVGVLQELEALGYDPDLVVGTSMGAVVGALYAAGHSPDEIRARILAIDWGEMFDPAAVVLGHTSVLRLPMTTFSLDLAQRRVSRGLFGEWRINRALVGLLFGANARAAGDFDRLARRYRAVAADLETGESVVLDSGDLARAARASMSYPGFFAPVRWGDRLLVDGGIADNLPVLEARRLGATTIIAVDLGRPRDEISQEPLAVAGRALQLMGRNMESDTALADILVLPDPAPAGVGPAFPDDPRPLIQAGREAARRDLPPAPLRDGGGERPLPPAPEHFAALRVEAPDSALARFVREVFSRVAPGPYDVPAVLAAVDRLYGTGLFAGVWPGVDAEGVEGGAPTLVVRVDAAARLSVAAAAGFENDRGGRAWAAVDRTASLASRPVVLRAALSTDGIERWGALSARLHTSARPAIAWSIGGHVQEASVRTFADDTRTTLEVFRSGGWAGIELPHLLRERLVTLTALAEWIDPEDARGANAFGPLLRITGLPTEARVVGIPLLVEAEARWGGMEYRRIELAGARAVAWPAFQAAALVDVRAIDGEAPVDVHPALGDEHAVPGLRWGEGRGRARVVGGVDLAVPIWASGFARLRLRSGAVADGPEQWERARWVTGALLGGVWRTPLGILEAGFGYATTGDGRLDVSIGRSF